MTNALLACTASGPLLPEHHQELLEANLYAKKIRAAARVASFNGWTTGVFAALSLPFALSSLPSLVIAIGLAIVAYNEFRGRNRLHRFDPTAARLLGWNQLALMAVLIVYSLWNIGLALAGPLPYEDEIRANPELNSVLGSIDGLFLMATFAVYGSLILGTILFQGLNAWYYFSRRKHVEAYLATTPDWIVGLQRSIPMT